jgi:hypothetical protein
VAYYTTPSDGRRSYEQQTAKNLEDLENSIHWLHYFCELGRDRQHTTAVANTRWSTVWGALSYAIQRNRFSLSFWTSHVFQFCMLSMDCNGPIWIKIKFILQRLTYRPIQNLMEIPAVVSEMKHAYDGRKIPLPYTYISRTFEARFLTLVQSLMTRYANPGTVSWK